MPYKVAAPRPLKVAASQTLAVGDALAQTTSADTVEIALANSAELVGVCAQVCSSLDANTEIMVWCDPDDIFLARQDGTDAIYLAAEPDLTGGTGAMQLDGSETSTDVFKLVGGPVKNDDGSTPTAAAGRRWLVKINKHALATDAG